MKDINNIGVIGAGTMGIKAISKLVETYSTYAFDLNENSLIEANNLGANICSSLEEISSICDVLIMFLPKDEHVRSVVNEIFNNKNIKSQYIIDLSTVSPSLSEEMSNISSQRNIFYFDAPILGRPSAIGNWTLPIGGNYNELENIKCVLSTFAKNIIYVGKPGSGNKVKILNQMMFGAINAMTGEMMKLADISGVTSQKLYEVMTSSRAGTVSNLFIELGNSIIKESYENPSFTVELLYKDLSLGVDLAKDNNFECQLLNKIQQFNSKAITKGYGNFDTSILLKVM